MVKRYSHPLDLSFFVPSVTTLSIFYFLLFSVGLLSISYPINIGHAQTSDTLKNKNFVVVNTTSTLNCPEFYGKESVISNNANSQDKNTSSTIHVGNTSNIKSTVSNSTINSNNTITATCPSLKIVYPYDCSSDENKTQELMCRVLENEDEDNDEGQNNTNQIDEDTLDNEIFDENGMLIVDTKFNKQYSYQIIDPLNPNKTIDVNLDLGKHTQSHNNKINSPRIEIERENADGTLDMNAAKNQIITWKGNILDYFVQPKGKFDNETYIEMMFNTGFHSSNEDDQRRGIGVVYDVSNESAPYIMDYRDNGRYTKLTLNEVQDLAGSDFIFHSNNNKSKDYYINDLLNKTNVTLKVKTYLTDQNKRVIQVFIDPGTGKEILYWTLKDVSKLQNHEGIKDKKGFLETVSQGSGFTYVRTDNVETRLSSFESTILNPHKQ